MTISHFDTKGILPVIKRNSGCDYHRIIQPLKSMGMDLDNPPPRSTDELLKETKIFIFNRVPENNFDQVLKLKKQHGFKIVQDLDDYWELNVKHPLYNTWIKNKMGEEIILWMKNADAVTVTTSRLADKVKQYNKNVHVIPNGLPFDQGQFNSTKTKCRLNVSYIFTGGESHLWDIQILKAPLSKLCNRELPSAWFMLGSYSDKPIWKKMESAFNVGGRLKNYEKIYHKPLDSYMDTYNEADVSLVPLEYNIFTPYKSNIKFLEAGCKNMPVICSNTPPYSDEPNKRLVMYASNAREWFYHIKYCHDNPDFIIESGWELGEHVREKYELTKINELRQQLFDYLKN